MPSLKHFTQEESVLITETICRLDIDATEKARILNSSIPSPGRDWTASQIAKFCRANGKGKQQWQDVAYALTHPPAICHRCLGITDQELSTIRKDRSVIDVEQLDYSSFRNGKHLFRRIASRAEEIGEDKNFFADVVFSVFKCNVTDLTSKEFYLVDRAFSLIEKEIIRGNRDKIRLRQTLLDQFESNGKVS